MTNCAPDFIQGTGSALDFAPVEALRACEAGAAELFSQGHTDAALARVQAAAQLFPADWRVLDLWAELSLSAGRHAMAFNVASLAVALAGDERAIPLGTLAAASLQLGDLLRARRLATLAERLDPTIPKQSPRFWIAWATAADDLETAWDLARPLRWRNVPSGVPVWCGEPLAGRRIGLFLGVKSLVAEMGFGDQIQTARYASALRERGARVTVICAPELVELFRTLAAADAVEPIDHAEELRLDYMVQGDSVAAALRVRPDVVAPGPYLAAARRQGLGRGGSRRVGFAWRGNPTRGNDHNRSMPHPGPILDALRGEGFEPVSLDVADTGAQTFAETANLIEGLAAVLSVDTAVAHLAGAMGKPLALLLPAHGADWRWGLSATTSYYQSATIFRQPHPQDWGSVASAAAVHLAAASPTF